jgi:response regulator of citrate/malate metabolism
MKLIDDPVKAIECAQTLANERGLAAYIYRTRDNKMRVSRAKLNHCLVETIKPKIQKKPRPQVHDRLKAEDVDLIRQIYQSDEPKRQRIKAIEKEIKQLLDRVEALKDEKKENMPLSSHEIADKFDISAHSVRRAINKMKGRK